MPPKHSGIAQKTLYTLNEDQKRSFMTYDYMKMYVNGSSNWTNILETDVEIFLKFGLGVDYYEFTQAVYEGWDEELNRLYEFADIRYEVGWDNLIDEFDLGGTVNINLLEQYNLGKIKCYFGTTSPY